MTTLIKTIFESKTISSITFDIIIKTLTTTISSISNMIKYLYKDKFEINEIINILTLIDLEYTVIIIDQLIKEQDINKLNESLKKSLVGVTEILIKIDNELNSIKKAIEYHNTKYFKSWRKFYWNGNLEILKQHNTILVHRYNILFKLLKIYHKN